MRVVRVAAEQRRCQSHPAEALGFIAFLAGQATFATASKYHAPGTAQLCVSEVFKGHNAAVL